MPAIPTTGRPIFMDLADSLAGDVLAGRYRSGDQMPSTTELAVGHRINPATAGKALNLLVERGVLEKRRGLGMFVTEGGPDLLREARRAAFRTDYVAPLWREAQHLRMAPAEVIDLVRKHPLAAGPEAEADPAGGSVREESAR